MSYLIPRISNINQDWLRINLKVLGIVALYILAFNCTKWLKNLVKRSYILSRVKWARLIGLILWIVWWNVKSRRFLRQRGFRNWIWLVCHVLYLKRRRNHSKRDSGCLQVKLKSHKNRSCCQSSKKSLI